MSISSITSPTPTSAVLSGFDCTDNYTSSPHSDSSRLSFEKDTPIDTCLSTVNHTPNLTLEERRQRNKTASAKYRAKKSQQEEDMKNTISMYEKKKDFLMIQLNQVQQENIKLRAVCDKLRGKMFAKKLVKKFLDGNTHFENTQ